ncbi:hypothetical protein ACWGB8_05685 [Kitasatospora sp. NPDC054939]
MHDRTPAPTPVPPAADPQPGSLRETFTAIHGARVEHRFTDNPIGVRRIADLTGPNA